MNRRKFIGLLGSGIAVTNPSPMSAFGQRSQMEHTNPGAGSSASKPNFLFMICDDLAFRTIHSINNSQIHTPNMDRLAASGCVFTHAFHQGSWSPAVCLPSRFMLNSGLTAFHVRDGIEDVPLWGQTLQRAGYDTYISGKWHLDTTCLQRSFMESGPIALGMLASTPMPGPGVPGEAYYRPRPGDSWTPWDKSLKGHWVHTGLWVNEFPDRIEHSSTVWSNSFIDHLETKAAKRDRPFFMYLGFSEPHDPRQSSKEFLDLYPQHQMEVPPNFLPQHPFDQGDYRIRDEILAPFPRTRADVQLHRREYYAIISMMDRQIGRVLDALERSGKASNTYVILTADHGLAVGEHGLMGKQNMYDCSVRVPLMIAGPGIPKGKRIDELVYQHCLYATTCELAGVPAPKTVGFPSLVPLLHGTGGPIYDAIFSYYRGYQRMVRTKTHKLIVYPQLRRYPGEPRMQVFDLEKDPWEISDLSGNPGVRAGIRQDLMKRLNQLQEELDDPLSLNRPPPEGDDTL